MEYYIPMTNNEFSQKKLEEYDKLEKIINFGRRNPIWFMEQQIIVKNIGRHIQMLPNIL